MVRAAGYLLYAYEQLPTPREVGDLESKFVHLVWRVQAGARLYPPWRNYPHVTNFFSPGYFLVVGLLGKVSGADLHGLFVIGRAVTVACALLTAIVLGFAIGRNCGLGAGIIGAVASLGAAPMIGAALMVRPDTMAELLSTAGFLLVLGKARWTCVAGLLLLLAAILTKQTAAIFLMAASAALWASGRPGRATWLLSGGVLAAAAVVALGTLYEPMFASSLVGEARAPMDLLNWVAQLHELGAGAPDLLVVPLFGLVVWLAERPRQTGPIILWLVVLTSGLLTAVKLGSGLNYFLSLRLIEAMALGTMWRVAKSDAGRSPIWLAAALLLTSASLSPGAILAVQNARLARLDAQFYPRPAGQRFLQAQRQIFEIAEDPQRRLLTDSGLLQLHQKERAPFVDPFQFRWLVSTGVIRPEVILENLRAQSYDLVITTSELYRREYDASTSGFPEVIARAAREHYRPADRRLGLFIYVPRGSRRAATAVNTPLP
jgi:hypothetical protein